MIILSKTTASELPRRQAEAEARIQSLAAEEAEPMDAVQRIYHSMGLDQLKERKHHHDKAVEAREALTVDLSKAEERLALGKSRGIAPVILACWGDEIRKLKQRLAAA